MHSLVCVAVWVLRYILYIVYTLTDFCFPLVVVVVLILPSAKLFSRRNNIPSYTLKSCSAFSNEIKNNKDRTDRNDDGSPYICVFFKNKDVNNITVIIITTCAATAAAPFHRLRTDRVESDIYKIVFVTQIVACYIDYTRFCRAMRIYIV